MKILQRFEPATFISAVYYCNNSATETCYLFEVGTSKKNEKQNQTTNFTSVVSGLGKQLKSP